MSSFTQRGAWPIQATKKINKLCGGESGRRPHLGQLIEVGHVLTQQKERLGTTKWGQWIDETLPFSRPTAQRYTHLYRAFVMGQKSGKGF